MTLRRRPADRAWRTAIGATCLALAVAGCGTRVHVAAGRGGGLGTNATAGDQAGGPGGGAASAGGGAAGAASGQGGAGAATAGIAGGQGQGSTALARTTGAGTGAGASASGSKAPSIPGVSASTLKIGYTYSDTATFSAFAAACSACSTFGDQTYFPGLFTQLANDLNAHGGVLGHKVQFDGYPYNSTAAVSDSAQLNQTVQAACQNFAQDDPSFAVISGLGSLISPCLTKSGISTIAQNGSIGNTIDEKTLQSSLLYAPGATVTELYMPVYLARLAAMGFFGGWDPTTGAASALPPKIGLVSFSDPEFIRQDQILEQDMKAAGYQIADHEWYSAELDTQSQSVQNAILKFRADGITHVLGTGANGLFMYESVGQNYYPRYAFQTASISDGDANSQKGLQGSMGVGEQPVADIDPNQNPPSVGPQQARCEQFATQAGVGWQSNQDFHAESLQICDAVWSLVAALQKGGTLTAAGLAGGFDALGSVPSAVSFSETWSATRHASASTVGDFQYYTSCSCFRYTGTRTGF